MMSVNVLAKLVLVMRNGDLMCLTIQCLGTVEVFLNKTVPTRNHVRNAGVDRKIPRMDIIGGMREFLKPFVGSTRAHLAAKLAFPGITKLSPLDQIKRCCHLSTPGLSIR